MKIAPVLRIFPAYGVGSRHDLKMLGRNGVDQRQRLVEIAHQNDRAEILPGRARNRRARQSFELRGDGRFDVVCQRRVVGHQDRLRGGVVLGLRQQIGSDPIRIGVASATIRTSDGPAIMSMPTLPNTSRLAAAT